MRDFCPGSFPTSGSPGSSSSRHRYSCRRDTPNSLVKATMLSQPLIRSTATCRKCSEYRLFATRSFLSCKVCLLLLSHFWGSLHSDSQRDGTNISPQNRLAPDRLAATVTSACKNPIVWFVVTADLFPFAECLQDSWMNWHRLLGRFSLAGSDYTIHDRSRHIHRLLGKVDIIPLHCK